VGERERVARPKGKKKREQKLGGCGATGNAPNGSGTRLAQGRSSLCGGPKGGHPTQKSGCGAGSWGGGGGGGLLGVGGLFLRLSDTEHPVTGDYHTLSGRKPLLCGRSGGGNCVTGKIGLGLGVFKTT